MVFPVSSEEYMVLNYIITNLSICKLKLYNVQIRKVDKNPNIEIT